MGTLPSLRKWWLSNSSKQVHNDKVQQCTEQDRKHDTMQTHGRHLGRAWRIALPGTNMLHAHAQGRTSRVRRAVAHEPCTANHCRAPRITQPLHPHHVIRAASVVQRRVSEMERGAKREYPTNTRSFKHAHAQAAWGQKHA